MIGERKNRNGDGVTESKGSKRTKVIFDVELLTADQDALTGVCDELATVMWMILEMQHFPIVDAVDDVSFRIEEVKE